MVICGGAGTILNLLLGNLVRAEGGATAAALGVALGGVCNIILDPIFVLPQFLGMGAEGAGAATAISNLLSALFFIAYVLISAADGGLSLPRLPARRGPASEKRARHRLPFLRAVRADGGGGGGAVQVRLRL